MEKINMDKYWISTVVAMLLGIWTVMPAPASKPCFLGYYAHCSWTPWSTVVCLTLTGILYLIGQRRRISEGSYLKNNKIWSIGASLKLLIGVAVLLYLNLLLMLYFNAFYSFNAETFEITMFVFGIDLLLTAIVIFFAGRHYKRLTRLFSREVPAEDVR